MSRGSVIFAPTVISFVRVFAAATHFANSRRHYPKEDEIVPASPSVPSISYTPIAIGAPASDFGRPWVTNVAIVDLDGDGLLDVLCCAAVKTTVRWIRQAPRGVFNEQIAFKRAHKATLVSRWRARKRPSHDSPPRPPLSYD